MQQIVISGAPENVTALAQSLLTSRVSLAIAVSHPDEALVAAAAVTTNTVVPLSAKAWPQVAVLIITPYPVAEDADRLAAQLAGMRQVINEAMDKGFTGKILIAAPQDEILTYFAQRFSGLAKKAVVGLGTFGLTRTFENTVATSLAVPRTSVTAYAVGTATDFVLMWSRAYVGATPVLSLLRNADGTQSPLMAEVQTACDAFAKADQAAVRPLLVERVLAAFAGESLLTSLMAVPENSDEPVAAARPLVCDADGVRRLSDLLGSEAEEAALSEVLAAVSEQLTAIEKGDSNEA
ncbi:Rossmann-fold NAD(P)-binding domain-containing protein [Lacticaseibacillus yichunensis]|uniref:Lactate dehydrogenase n=1 Tax=Lacticaseibacillus yichunensis TaxID=2486015 RepID=A0ABW4CR81_9LACO|nr:lactate dehydrogenase [Lacticaseibacillus yichunensis]